MKFDDLVNEVERINLVNETFGTADKIDYKVSISECLHKHGKSFRAHFPSKEIVDKESNGIYCFLDTNKEILYIGKGASNNISREMFKKIPLPVVIDELEDIATFEQNYWSEMDLPEFAKESIAKGNFFVGFIILKSSEITSKMEIYLQTIYAKTHKGQLPPLNSRIG